MNGESDRIAELAADPAVRAEAKRMGRLPIEQALSMALPYEQASESVAGGETHRRAHTRPLAAIQPERVSWLIADRVPLGMFTIVAGEPGLGKSTLTATWAAEVSRGQHVGAATDVLLVGGEDLASAVVRPRVQAAGGDLERVHLFDMFDEHGAAVVELPDDLPDIEREIERHGAQLVVIDPLNAHLSGSIDSHKDASLRRALAPLSAMAARTGAAIVGVAHLNKSQGGTPLNRLGGSVGYGGVARSVLMFLRDPDDPDGDHGSRRLLTHPKCNVGPEMPSLIYEHESTTVAGDVPVNRLKLVGESTITAREALGATGDDNHLRGDAAEVILAVLADGQPHDAREVKAEVIEALECSARTVERAAKTLEHSGDLKRHLVGKPPRAEWQLADSDTAPAATNADSPLPVPVAIRRTPATKGNPTPSPANSDTATGGDANCPKCGSLLATVKGSPVCFHCAIEGEAGLTARERVAAVRSSSRHFDPAELPKGAAA